MLVLNLSVANDCLTEAAIAAILVGGVSDVTVAVLMLTDCLDVGSAAGVVDVTAVVTAGLC